MAELIVPSFFIGVGKNLVGLVELFHLLLALLVVGVKVGVVLLDTLSVCFFYFIFRSALAQSENFVEILFLCHKITPQRRLFFTFFMLMLCFPPETEI